MDLKTLCKSYDLDAVPEFWETSEVRLHEVYNGAGPDWLPAWGRKILTTFLRIFKASFIVHDFDFDISDKSMLKFHEANDRMFSNMKKILDKEYPFSKIYMWPVRARWWLRMNGAYKAVEKFGLSAWKD